MDNELLNEEMTEQTIEENPIGDAAEAGGESLVVKLLLLRLMVKNRSSKFPK